MVSSQSAAVVNNSFLGALQRKKHYPQFFLALDKPRQKFITIKLLVVVIDDNQVWIQAVKRL